MKHIHISMFLGLIVLFASCKKDNSNYDYKSNEQITVSGIESVYNVVSEKDKLVITPTIESTDADAEFDYMWGIYETNVQGYAPVLDTIAKTKDLNYFIKQPAKAWVLVYRVTNKKTKYAKYTNVTINVGTEFTRGWYVLKDDGTKSDLDLFLSSSATALTEVKENVYSLINGAKLDGKARMINLFSSYKSDVTGIVANTKALFMVSDKDVSAINVNTMKQIRNMNTLFFERPSTIAPNSAFCASSAYYLINAGQVYSIGTNSLNTGVFGGRKLKDALNSPYYISDYYYTGTYGDPCLFDDLNSTFVTLANGSGTTLTNMTDVAGTAMPAVNNNKKALYMGFKSATYIPAPVYGYTTIGFGIFQDKTNAALKILTQMDMDKLKLKLTNDTLKTTDKIYNATMHTLLDADENMIYFVLNNQIWSRNLSNKFEQLQYSPPAGEVVTFIRHKKYAVVADAAFNYNYVMVGTQSGADYKVRMFTKSSGSLSATPALTLTGKGIVRDVMYMSPSVSEYSYSNTY